MSLRSKVLCPIFPLSHPKLVKTRPEPSRAFVVGGHPHKQTRGYLIFATGTTSLTGRLGLTAVINHVPAKSRKVRSTKSTRTIALPQPVVCLKTLVAWPFSRADRSLGNILNLVLIARPRI